MNRLTRVNRWARLILFTVTGCSVRAAPPAVARMAPTVSERVQRPATQAVSPAPAPKLAEVTADYDAALELRREQAEVRRQVAELQQAVLLYTAFLERAAGRPELEPAVRKSRERRADAIATIEFLLASGGHAGANERRE